LGAFHWKFHRIFLLFWPGGPKKGNGHHHLTGPIYIDGAKPGDVLEIEILDAIPKPYCFSVHFPGVIIRDLVTGFLFQRSEFRIPIQISKAKNEETFFDRIYRINRIELQSLVSGSSFQNRI